MKRDPITLKLSEPVRDGNDMLTSLTLRPPKGKDLRLAGYPFRIGGTEAKGEMTIDSPAISKLVSMLAGVPPSTVDQLEAEDWQACMTAVSGFLAPTTPATSPTDISSSPDGGAIPDTSGT